MVNPHAFWVNLHVGVHRDDLMFNLDCCIVHVNCTSIVVPQSVALRTVTERIGLVDPKFDCSVVVCERLQRLQPQQTIKSPAHKQYDNV